MNTGVAMPPRALLALVAMVLAMHALLLQRTPARVHTAAAPPRAPAFATRRVDLLAPAISPEPALAPARVKAVPSPRAAARLQIDTAAPDHAGRPAAAPSVAAPAPDIQPGRVSVPGAMHLQYAVTALRRQQLVQGTSELLWDPDDQRYEASFAVSLDGVPARRQHSAGQLGAAGLSPQRFAEINRGEQATHFERDGGRVIFSNNRPAVPLLAGAQDRLSIMIQLSALFAGEPGRYPPGTSIAIQTATTREAQSWVFTVEGEEQLQLPAGDMTTVKLIRPPQAQYDQSVEIWLAPGEAYAPVRLRLTQPNGDWVDHQWSATDRR